MLSLQTARPMLGDSVSWPCTGGQRKPGPALGVSVSPAPHRGSMRARPCIGGQREPSPALGDSVRTTSQLLLPRRVEDRPEFSSSLCQWADSQQGQVPEPRSPLSRIPQGRGSQHNTDSGFTVTGLSQRLHRQPAPWRPSPMPWVSLSALIANLDSSIPPSPHLPLLPPPPRMTRPFLPLPLP